MIDRRNRSFRRWTRFSLVAGLAAVGLSLLVRDAAHAEIGVVATPNITPVALIAEDAGWRSGETPVPGEFPNAPVDDLGARRIHYVDAAGVKRTSVLVFMDPSISTRAVQRTNVRALAARKGGVVRYEYGAVMPGVLNLRDIPESAVETLKKMPGVLKVEKDEYHPNAVRLTKSTPLIRGLQSQITGAGLSADGAGVRVCVADTGIDMDHTMYASRIDAAASWDFANNDPNPDDDHGHGSHVSGIAVGGIGLQIDLGCGTVPFQGVAPAATLIGAKILNSFGGGTDSDIIAGIDHCADQSASGGQADVINLSIGTGNFGGICTHSWAVAANNAVANGVVVVAASGNECNTNSMGSPACGADVIAVGATYKDDYPNCEDSTSSFNWCGTPQTGIGVDDIVDFSNQSDFLDVTAPGSVIWSASNSAGGGSVTGMSGTSMSSPHVAGLAALIIGVDPTLTPAEVRQVIRDGAIDMGPAGFDRGYGYGRIDVIGSLQLLTPCANNGDCDDGQWCNGAETCSAGSCFAGSDPCPGQSCDEATDTCVAAPTLQLEWNMDTNPGWTTQGLWAWGQPTGGGGQYGGPDPTGGATGNNVYGYNLSGDYENNLAEQHLTTGAIDCSSLAEVSVQFQRWLGVETPTYDHAYFRISTNGSTWTTLWSNGAEVADTSWSLQSFDISAIADGQPTVFLRWTLGTTDGSWRYCGWNIDDVQIWARGTGGGCSTNGDCDDGDACTTDTCDTGSGVCSNTSISCDDGNLCTDDSCNPATGCVNTNNAAACDDGDACTTGDTCSGGACVGGAPPNCDDGNLCTDDSCDPGTGCVNADNTAACDDGNTCTDDTCAPATGCANTNNTAACDDGDACTTGDTCSGGACAGGAPPNCDDGDICTDDTCDPATGCVNANNAAACDDGDACTTGDTCAGGACVGGAPPNCDDGNLCTDDSCDPGTGCVNTNNAAACDDGDACTTGDTCAGGSCAGGAPPNCNDGNVCTDDSCDPGSGCVNANNAAACDDGDACTAGDACSGGACVGGATPNCDDGDACTTDSCDPATGSCVNATISCDDGNACTDDSCDFVTGCVNTNNSAMCDDGDACTTGDACSAGVCTGGAPPNCDDGDVCTDDSCDPATGCVYTNNTAACDDGDACTTGDTCSGGACAGGAPPDCDDGNLCTDDSCDPGTGCVNANNAAACDDGDACTTGDTCSAGACVGGAPPNCDDGDVCTDDSCDPGTGCVNANNVAACDDGDACTTGDTCSAGACVGGAPPNCDDGDVCTDDSCDPATGCVNTNNAAACDDGDACTTGDTCAGGACVGGAPPDCDDGNACTDDSCDAGSGCVNANNVAACDDGDACTTGDACSGGACAGGAPLDCDDGDACTTDSCDPATGCANAPVDCDDGVGCTDDSCDPATGLCNNVANDANCPDDGLFCDGTESCDAVNDCVSSGDPCLAGETCNEATSTCDTGPPTGEGFVLSRNADFSTDDRSFFRNETLYMRMWTDQVDFNDISRERWELKDPAGNRIRQPLTNHFNGTWTASFVLSGLPSNDTDWTWKGEVKDNPGNRYKPSDLLTVLDAPACAVNADCDDGDACTTDVCSGGACSNTAVNCDDGDACTADSCSGGACFNDPSSCDDGDACTTDTCDPGAGCNNTPVNCDDGDACTADSCSGGICFNDPLPTCCGDTFCDPGEDSCNCPADCGAPPAAETNCTDGIDEDCDGATDCADADCTADPACSTPTGEGFILSLNPDFSTDDRVFTRADMIYMKLWTDAVDFNDINRNRWELKDPQKNKVRQPMTNHFDGTYTASFDLSGLPSNDTSWTWKGEAKDNAGNRYKPTTSITVNP